MACTVEEMKLYETWLNSAKDADVLAELKDVQGKDEEISDRFYRYLEFGTGGLRGVIGAGTNRMNIYTVRMSAQALADYLAQKGGSHAVAIGYDSRIKSTDFAKCAAATLASNGVKVHIFPELQPTPVLSYAVRELHCSAAPTKQLIATMLAAKPGSAHASMRRHSAPNWRTASSGVSEAIISGAAIYITTPMKVITAMPRSVVIHAKRSVRR